MIRVLAAVVACGWLATSSTFALDTPALTGRVNDQAGVLGSGAEQLTEKLRAYEVASKHQFVFLSVETLSGGSIEELAVAAFHAWKLGDAKRDDGLLFVVAKAERRMRIEVGYGLEGEIPDAVAKRIIDEVAKPAFKRGDFVGGVNAVFDECAKAVAKDAGPVSAGKASEGPFGEWFWAILFGLISLCTLPFILAWINDRRDDSRRRERELGDEAVRQMNAWPVSGDNRGTASKRRKRWKREDEVVRDAGSTVAATLLSASQSSSDYSSSSSDSQSLFGGSDSSSSFDSSSSSSSSGDSFSGGGGDSGGGGASGGWGD